MAVDIRKLGIHLTLGVAALMAGCSGFPLPDAGGSTPGKMPPDYVNVERTDNILIQLIPTGLGAQPVNDHPAAFDPEQVQALLLSMRIRSADEGVVTLASPTRLGAVAEGLAEALARAQPNQDVFLMFFRSRDGRFGFSGERLATTARVFFKEDQLNLVFDELDNIYSSFRDPQTNPLKPGSRIEVGDVDGERLVERDTWQWRGDRRDWVQLYATGQAINSARENMPATTSLGADRSAQSLKYGPASAEGAPSGEAADEATSPSSTAETGTMPAAPAASPAGEVGDAPSTSPSLAAGSDGGTAESTDPGDNAWQRIETRLQSLKKLRDQGLISEQDYEDKKDELLEDLP
ncbi:SHOCT domain-containing protein [Salinisphaera sp. P385]|uniref:SHOCT domain-containing protein n=1 Tax=Spectribacter acetivorans TaxID=3075603 RepID=A0ABU3BDZ6_9GAMM|nr:SHOCT domain-containing protein [Salinisphaera sp. P385]MDT0619756.1 SHOCT domain-containing protein [Salinisphaera sp. P385]